MPDDERVRLLMRTYAERQDDQAFGQIVREHSALVRSACRRHLHDPALIDDATQETFIKLAQAPASVTGSLAGWLHVCATTTAINLRLSDQRRRQRERAFASASGDHVGDADHARVTSLVQECLAELPRDERDLIVGYYVERQTQTALAERAGISQVGLGKRLHNAVERLRGRLRRHGVTMSAAALLGLLGGTGHAATRTPAPVGRGDLSARADRWRMPALAVVIAGMIALGVAMFDRASPPGTAASSSSNPAPPPFAAVDPAPTLFADAFADGLGRWRIRHLPAHVLPLPTDERRWLEGPGPGNRIAIVTADDGERVLDIDANAGTVWLIPDAVIDAGEDQRLVMRYRIRQLDPARAAIDPGAFAHQPLLAPGAWLDSERHLAYADGRAVFLASSHGREDASSPRMPARVRPGAESPGYVGLILRRAHAQVDDFVITRVDSSR